MNRAAHRGPGPGPLPGRPAQRARRRRQRLFAGCFGIFGHGNVAGLGQALLQASQTGEATCATTRPATSRRMVHAAVGFARMRNRLQAFACTSSIGPGATNMVTGAALATINRLPVLLLPGDFFATRAASPVLQELEDPRSLRRLRQRRVPAGVPLLRPGLPARAAAVGAAGRDAGAHRPGRDRRGDPRAARRTCRPRPTTGRQSCSPSGSGTCPGRCPSPPRWPGRSRCSGPPRRPLIVAGGGVIYSEASDALRRVRRGHRHPGGRDPGGQGRAALRPPAAPSAASARPAPPAANALAREADVVIGIGTRYSDFTTASRTAFAQPGRPVRQPQRRRRSTRPSTPASPLVADARAALRGADRGAGAADRSSDGVPRAGRGALTPSWEQAVDQRVPPRPPAAARPSPRSSARSTSSWPTATWSCARPGRMPGDLHKLWRTRDPKGYHVEYGYSCMGYEIAGGLGVKLAAPDREVYVLVGDGSYLMMATELVTAVAEGIKLIVVLVQNHGFALHRRAVRVARLAAVRHPLPLPRPGHRAARRRRAAGRPGRQRGEPRRRRAEDGDGQGVRRGRSSRPGRRTGPGRAHRDRPAGPVPSCESWWDVPVAEVSALESTQQARAAYEAAKRDQRLYL